MNKEAELKRAKRLALSLLGLAAAVFVTTLCLPPNFWVSAAKAIAEAAMVGALADWFAVVALFRRVPLPLVSRHTAIIPRNKARIADNLATFVQEKFLDTESLLALIRRHNPAHIVGCWLQNPDNAERLGGHLLQFMRGILDMADDQRIQRFIRSAVHKAIDKVDLTQSVAVLLESLTKNNRHQQLLDTVIEQLLRMVNKPSTREFIAIQIIRWLKREHPLTEKILPSEWLGERSAEVVANAVNTLLDEVVRDEGHELRQHFNRTVVRLIERLRTDPDMAQRAEAIKRYLKDDEALNHYLSDLWGDLRAWLKADLNQSDSAVQARISAIGQWLGQTLMQDEGLRSSLNQHLEEAVRTLAPEFANFLTRHISDTVKSWDAEEMSRLIELNIGKDLQFIRINGTLVGGSIGLGLYLLSQLPDLIAMLRNSTTF